MKQVSNIYQYLINIQYMSILLFYISIMDEAVRLVSGFLGSLYLQYGSRIGFTFHVISRITIKEGVKKRFLLGTHF